MQIKLWKTAAYFTYNSNVKIRFVRFGDLLLKPNSVTPLGYCCDVGADYALSLGWTCTLSFKAKSILWKLRNKRCEDTIPTLKLYIPLFVHLHSILLRF